MQTWRCSCAKCVTPGSKWSVRGITIASRSNRRSNLCITFKSSISCRRADGRCGKSDGGDKRPPHPAPTRHANNCFRAARRGKREKLTGCGASKDKRCRRGCCKRPNALRGTWLNTTHNARQTTTNTIHDIDHKKVSLPDTIINITQCRYSNMCGRLWQRNPQVTNDNPQAVRFIRRRALRPRPHPAAPAPTRLNHGFVFLACSSLANATARGTPSSRVFSGDGLASPAADLPS